MLIGSIDFKHINNKILKALNEEDPVFFDARQDLQNDLRQLFLELKYNYKLSVSNHLAASYSRPLRFYFYFIRVLDSAFYVSHFYREQKLDQIAVYKAKLKNMFYKLDRIMHKNLCGDTVNDSVWQDLLKHPVSQQMLVVLLFCDQNPDAAVLSTQTHHALAMHLCNHLSDTHLKKAIDYMHRLRTGEPVYYLKTTNPLVACEQAFETMADHDQIYDNSLVQRYVSQAVLPKTSAVPRYLRRWININLSVHCAFYTLAKYGDVNHAKSILKPMNEYLMADPLTAIQSNFKEGFLLSNLVSLAIYNNQLNFLTPWQYTNFLSDKVDKLQLMVLEQLKTSSGAVRSSRQSPDAKGKIKELSTELLLLSHVDKKLKYYWLDAQLDNADSYVTESLQHEAMVALQYEAQPLLAKQFSPKDAQVCQFALSLFQAAQAMRQQQAPLFAFNSHPIELSHAFKKFCNNVSCFEFILSYIQKLINDALSLLYELRPPSLVTDTQQLAHITDVYNQVIQLSSQLTVGNKLDKDHLTKQFEQYQCALKTSGADKGHQSRGKKTRKKRGKSGKEGSQPLTTKPDTDHDSVSVTEKDHEADKPSYSSYEGVEFGGNILSAGGTVFAKGRPLDDLSIDCRAYDPISSSSQTNSVIPRQRIPQSLFHLAQMLNDEPKDPARLLLTGNAIPDLLFNQRPNDFDCLVNADLDELNCFLQSQGYATCKINAKRYPLLKVPVLDDKGLPTTVEMGYLKCEPHQSLEDAIQENMANRDFAISALYADITEACRQGDVQPIDVIGGEGFKALQKRQITMHETNGLTAEDQLRQDPTRLLRLANLLINYSGRMILSDQLKTAVLTVNTHSQWHRFLEHSDDLHKRMGTKFEDLFGKYPAEQVLSVLINQVPVIPAMTGMPLPFIKDCQPIWARFIRQKTLVAYGRHSDSESVKATDAEQTLNEAVHPSDDAYKKKLCLFYCLFAANCLANLGRQAKMQNYLYPMVSQVKTRDQHLHESKLNYLSKQAQLDKTDKFGLLKQRVVDNLRLAVPLSPLMKLMEAKVGYYPMIQAVKLSSSNQTWSTPMGQGRSDLQKSGCHFNQDRHFTVCPQ